MALDQVGQGVHRRMDAVAPGRGLQIGNVHQRKRRENVMADALLGLSFQVGEGMIRIRSGRCGEHDFREHRFRQDSVRRHFGARARRCWHLRHRNRLADTVRRVYVTLRPGLLIQEIRIPPRVGKKKGDRLCRVHRGSPADPDDEISSCGRAKGGGFFHRIHGRVFLHLVKNRIRNTFPFQCVFHIIQRTVNPGGMLSRNDQRLCPQSRQLPAVVLHTFFLLIYFDRHIQLHFHLPSMPQYRKRSFCSRILYQKQRLSSSPTS